MSRHPSPSPSALAKAKPGPFRLSDDYRMPFPELTPGFGRASYELSSLGRVYRIEDGCLLRPDAKTLKIKLNAGRVCMSLPLAVYRAFGLKLLHDEYVPWVSPNAPLDELTQRRSCATEYVKLVHKGDLVRLGRGALTLEDIRLFNIR